MPAAIKPAVCYSLGHQHLRQEHLLKRQMVGQIETAKAEPESGCEIQTTASAAVSNPIDHPSKLFPIQLEAPWLHPGAMTLIEPRRYCRGRKNEPVAAVVPHNFPRWQNTLILLHVYDTRIIMNGVLPNEWFDAVSSIRWRCCVGFSEHSNSSRRVAWQHLVLWQSSAIREAMSKSAAEFLIGQVFQASDGVASGFVPVAAFRYFILPHVELACDVAVAFAGLHGITLTHSGLDRLSPSSVTVCGPCTGTGAYCRSDC